MICRESEHPAGCHRGVELSSNRDAAALMDQIETVAVSEAETLRLVTDFKRIADPTVRSRVLQLVAQLAHDQPTVPHTAH
jgi:hypothetical protein